MVTEDGHGAQAMWCSTLARMSGINDDIAHPCLPFQDFVCNGSEWGTKDYRGYDWFKNGQPDASANHTNSAWLIQRAAQSYLADRKNSSHPFFMYLPFQNIHAPYTCDSDYRALYENRTDLDPMEMTVFGYISEMDAAVGAILKTLKESGLYENTVIIFSSDNGAPPNPGMDHQQGTNPGWIARNYPFRGCKTLIWEGGTRVPGFVHSPLLPASVRGTINEELYHVTDWLPTLAGLAGGSTQRNRPLDGHDIWSSLTEQKPSPRTELLYNVNPLQRATSQAGPPHAGLRMGKYVGRDERWSGGESGTPSIAQG